jgi:hypothetical protein
MNTEGALRKMKTRHESPVAYTMIIGENEIEMNALLDSEITLSYAGKIFCIECGRKTNKSFSQGYCYPCFKSKALCDRCIMSPELCHFAAGTCREPEWGERNCMQHHVVYLANASGLKIGITRGTQVPTRWMDQGAIQALPVFNVHTRLDSGLVESMFKSYLSDRTDWRKMLKNDVQATDLATAWQELRTNHELDLETIKTRSGADNVSEVVDQEVYSFDYPVLEYPEKVKALNFDKEPIITGVLKGIKGQYLIFDTGVLNIRKFGGYEISVDY